MSQKYFLLLSEQAKEDLLDIWQYIAIDSIESADSFVDFIYENCKKLSSYPEIGRKRDELIPGIRYLPIKRYLVFYRIKEKNVEVVRIVSAYRDLDLLF